MKHGNPQNALRTQPLSPHRYQYIHLVGATRLVLLFLFDWIRSSGYSGGSEMGQPDYETMFTIAHYLDCSQEACGEQRKSQSKRRKMEDLLY